MQPKLEETIYLDFVTQDSDGSASDADSTPAAEVFEDATDTTVVALTVTKRTSKTGNYRVPIACTAANGFEAGKSYNVVASATVGGVAGKAVIGRFQLRQYSVDGAKLGNIAHGGAAATLTLLSATIDNPDSTAVTIRSDDGGPAVYVENVGAGPAVNFESASEAALSLEGVVGVSMDVITDGVLINSEADGIVIHADSVPLVLDPGSVLGRPAIELVVAGTSPGIRVTNTGTGVDIDADIAGSVGSIAAGGIIAASFGAGAINAAAIATDALGASELAASAVTKIQAGLPSSAGDATAANQEKLLQVVQAQRRI